MLAPLNPGVIPGARPSGPNTLCPDEPFATLTLPVALSSSLRLTPEQLEQLCQANPEAVLELAADGHLMAMTPTGGEKSSRNSRLLIQLGEVRGPLSGGEQGLRLEAATRLEDDSAFPGLVIDRSGSGRSEPPARAVFFPSHGSVSVSAEENKARAPALVIPASPEGTEADLAPPLLPQCRRISEATPPPMAAASVHRLGHVALRVADMERAKAFYGALGLRLTWDAPDWAYLQSPVTGDGIALLSPAYTAAGPHFAFHLDNRTDLDAVHDQLEASGHRVGAVHDHRDGTASFYVQDPEGNWLEILYEPSAGIPSNTGAAAIPFAPLPASEEHR